MPDSPSISSSGYNDGLGRREIAFDREAGTLLERLYVRPDIGVFDSAISGRLDKLQSLVDERFARPVAVERDRGRVVVVSEYVSGVRIADVLESNDALQDAPTLDLALGFLLDALPALETFHTTTGIAHGLISSGRIVLASAPKVVFLDTAFGDVLGRLHYSRTRLWRELGLAMPESAGPSRATVGTDVGQVALTALMLVLGRTILDDEYPRALPSLVTEVSDVALIRGTEAFASGLQKFLQKALALSAAGYQTAHDALVDVQQIVELEMGANACNRALTTFIDQIDVGAQPLPAPVLADAPSIEVVGLDDEPEPALDLTSAEALVDELPVSLDTFEPTPLGQDVALDLPDQPAPIELPVASTEPMPVPFEEVAAPAFEEPAPPIIAEVTLAPADTERYDAPRDEPVLPKPEEKPVDDPWSFRPAPAREAAPAVAFEEPAVFEPPTPAEEPLSPEPPLAAEPAEPVPAIEPAAAAESEEEAEPARSSFFSPRRKRGEKSRSARARKDKLRSAAAAFKDSVMARVSPQADAAPPKPARDPEPRTPDSPRDVPRVPAARAPEVPRPAEPPRAAAPVFEPPPAPKPKPMVPPLIPASRAASFEPPVPEPAAPPPRPFAPPVAPIPPPVAPVASTPPVVFEPPAPPMPSFSQPPIALTPSAQAPAPIQLQGAPPISLSRSSPAVSAPPSGPALKLKTPVAPPRRERFEPPPSEFPDFPVAKDPAPRQFPWKLAAAAVVVILAGVVAGRAYLPDRKIEEQRAAKEAAEIAAAARLPPAKRGSGPVPMGKLTVETDQPGAKVLVDGLSVGQTPLTIDKPAGKYVVTVISDSGSVSRRVTIEAGKTAPLNVTLVSGWVAIFAPITFEVSEKGRFIGNTEDGRVMLSPGRHELTLTNKALGYSSVHTVDIQPTEVLPLTVEPKGRANFNASPGWAEVWLEDKKLGETPTSQELPLGVHTFVFKHAEFGERKVTATIKHDQPAAVSVDFNK